MVKAVALLQELEHLLEPLECTPPGFERIALYDEVEAVLRGLDRELRRSHEPLLADDVLPELTVRLQALAGLEARGGLDDASLAQAARRDLRQLRRSL